MAMTATVSKTRRIASPYSLFWERSGRTSPLPWNTVYQKKRVRLVVLECPISLLGQQSGGRQTPSWPGAPGPPPPLADTGSQGLGDPSRLRPRGIRGAPCAGEWNNLLEQENEILTGLPRPTFGGWVPRWTTCDLPLDAG